MKNIHDDIIVHGKMDEDHHKQLKKALKRIHNRGLTLNKEKCKSHMFELEFMEYMYLLSPQGIGPTKAKVEAITEAT